MSNHAYVNAFYHFVWSTKDRAKTITPSIQKELYDYIGGITKIKNWHLLEIGGTQDHIHILLQKPNKQTLLSNVVRCIKSNSSKYIRDTFMIPFSWQKGYGAFSTDITSIPRIKKYIANQENHHSQRSFEKEFELILNRYQIEYDKNNFLE